MENILSVIYFIVAVSILAFVHELGHFLTSKMFHIDVEEFGFGFPPKIKTLFRWKGTDFTINWIPFGAFVRPKGENNPDIPGGLASAHPLARIVVLLGGPIMNLLAGWFLFSLIFLQTGVPDGKVVKIGNVVKDSAAERAGLLSGDIILTANQQDISSIEKIRAIIQANPEKEIRLTINRDGQISEVRAVPAKNQPGGEGLLGVGLTNPVSQATWLQTIPIAGNVVIQYTRELFTLPVKLIMGQLSPEQSRVTSIVGLGNLFVQARERDIETETSGSGTPAVSVLSLMAIISVALGITNLMPIPALDGGRILFVLPEIIFRKRVPANFENAVHFIGFAALILLMVLVTIQDIVNPVVLP